MKRILNLKVQWLSENWQQEKKSFETFSYAGGSIKFLFAPLELFSQNNCVAALGKSLPQGVKFRFTKSTPNSQWVVGIYQIIEEKL